MKTTNKKVNNAGAVALILVIIITALTLISSVVIALVNISDMLSNYHTGQSQQASVDIDACVDDALLRIASSTAVTGNFNVNIGSLYCSYAISPIIDSYKTVTSTASSSSDLGVWFKSVVLQVGVSTSPMSIRAYRDNILMTCGDGICNNSENCSTCASDCGSCSCGDGWCTAGETCSSCTSDCGSCYCGDGACTTGETCSNCGTDCGACAPVCGNGVIESGENCEYLDNIPYCPATGTWCGACTSVSDVTCPGKNSGSCQNCVWNKNACASCSP